MSKLTKNQKLVADKVEAGKAYSLKEAVVRLHEFSLSVLPIRKLLLRKLAPTMLVLTSISRRSSRVGQMLM